MFAATIIFIYFYFLRQNFLSQQTRVCRDKHVFVATKVNLSQQDFCSDKNYVCSDKYLSRQKFCHRKNMFVTTKLFVGTKIILVAAPANVCVALQL